MEFTNILIDYFLSYKPWISLLVIVICYVAYKEINKFLLSRAKLYGITNPRLSSIKLGLNTARYALVILLIGIILNINGVNVSTLVTSIGISGIIIAFALQDIMKDWIMGISIVWDDYYSVGDIVQIDDVIGKVESFNLKTTKINDIVTGNTVSISNRNINKVSILSDWIDVEVPGAYTYTSDVILPLLDKIIAEIKQLDHVRDCKYLNISSFGASAITYKLRIYGDTENRFQTYRNALSIIQKIFEENDIHIPYNQLDVHMKEK